MASQPERVTKLHDAVKREMNATRQAAGIFDQTSFAKLLVQGRDAAKALNRICAANVDVEIGRSVYTGMPASATRRIERRPFLEIGGLWKAYGDFVALRDIDLQVKEGEFICFLGPSGCGKTTLLRAIAGLDIQSRGTICQGGQDISRLPPAQRDYGIVFQSYALFPNLTVEKNIAFGLENIGRPRREIVSRVSELLKLVGLSSQGRKYPAQLSGGQQQRVALARAMTSRITTSGLRRPSSAMPAVAVAAVSTV